jgi:hypothetical protein
LAFVHFPSLLLLLQPMLKLKVVVVSLHVEVTVATQQERNRLRLPGLTPTERPALREKLRAGCTVDRPVDATTAKERGICGIDDRIHPLLRDVAENYGDTVHDSVSHHGGIFAPGS